MVSVQPTMQPNYQAPDELIALFSRNLTFNPDQQAALLKEQLAQQAVPTPAPPTRIIYSSQHYTHSAHLAKPQAEGVAAPAQLEYQRCSSVPPESEIVSPETMLRSHGVNPAVLTPSQVQLFQVADSQQQLRLIELWSICPPNGAQGIPALAWSSTTVEQEEHLARARYERAQQDQPMSLDGTIVQDGDGRWGNQITDSEPYMKSGYEELMRREAERNAAASEAMSPHNQFDVLGSGHNYQRATDPVYLGIDYIRQQQQMAMATQYGAYEQFRGISAVDAMDM